MKNELQIKTHQLIIYVNELEEFETSITKRGKESISIIDLIHNIKSKNNIQILREDIFIGIGARWDAIKERLEEWQHLSFLRPGKLEVVYACDFHPETAKYSSDHLNYLHFYDKCVLKSEIGREFEKFNSTFEVNLKWMGTRDLNKTVALNSVNQNDKPIEFCHSFSQKMIFEFDKLLNITSSVA